MKLLRWILINSLFTVAIYFGFVEGVEGAENIAFGLAWLSIVSSFFLLSDSVQEKLASEKRWLPAWLNVSFDLCVTLAFLWFGHFVTAVFYIFHLLFVEAFWVGVNDKKKKQATSA